VKIKKFELLRIKWDEYPKAGGAGQRFIFPEIRSSTKAKEYTAAKPLKCSDRVGFET
jgi:hypothetical protein